jgi:hypothetical protein
MVCTCDDWDSVFVVDDVSRMSEGGDEAASKLRELRG